MNKDEQTLADLKEAIREAHGVLKDIRNAMKDARKLLGDEIESQVKGRVSACVEEGMGSLNENVTKTRKHIDQRFDELFAMVMGENRKGQAPIAHMIAIDTLKSAGGKVTVRHPKEPGRTIDHYLITVEEKGDDMTIGIPEQIADRVQVIWKHPMEEF